MNELIKCVDLKKFYHVGTQTVKALRSINLSIFQGRVCGYYGTFRIRKIHLNEYYWLP